MPPYRYESSDGGFSLLLPGETWKAVVFEDSEIDFAVSFESEDAEMLLLVRRFRATPAIRTPEDFDRVLQGVLMGLEEVLRPLKVLEKKLDRLGEGMQADLVVRGRQQGRDVMQRRRLMAFGPVPPSPLLLLTASCAADRFLVHRRTFEEILESFDWLGSTDHTPTDGAGE